MTDEDYDEEDADDPSVAGYMVVGDVGRAPRWYPYVIKLLLAVTAVLAVGAFAAETVYLVVQIGPSTKANAEIGRSNAAALAALARDTDIEQAADACYDQYTADINDANARGFAALAESDGSIGSLLVLLAAQPRDQAAVDAAIQRVGAAAKDATAAAVDYRDAIKARTDYSAAGRPLPCTNGPN